MSFDPAMLQMFMNTQGNQQNPYGQGMQNSTYNQALMSSGYVDQNQPGLGNQIASSGAAGPEIQMISQLTQPLGNVARSTDSEAGAAVGEAISAGGALDMFKGFSDKRLSTEEQLLSMNPLFRGVIQHRANKESEQFAKNAEQAAKSEYEGNILAQQMLAKRQVPQMAGGGSTNNVGQFPIIDEAKGNTHENGGIKQGGIEIEDGEVTFNDYIFSDRIPYRSDKTKAGRLVGQIANLGLTFAGKAKSILKKYKDRLGDKYDNPDEPSQNSMQKEMTVLRDEQEAVRRPEFETKLASANQNMEQLAQEFPDYAEEAGMIPPMQDQQLGAIPSPDIACFGGKRRKAAYGGYVNYISRPDLFAKGGDKALTRRQVADSMLNPRGSMVTQDGSVAVSNNQLDRLVSRGLYDTGSLDPQSIALFNTQAPTQPVRPNPLETNPIYPPVSKMQEPYPVRRAPMREHQEPKYKMGGNRPKYDGGGFRFAQGYTAPQGMTNQQAYGFQNWAGRQGLLKADGVWGPLTQQAYDTRYQDYLNERMQPMSTRTAAGTPTDVLGTPAFSSPMDPNPENIAPMTYRPTVGSPEQLPQTRGRNPLDYVDPLAAAAKAGLLYSQYKNLDHNKLSYEGVIPQKVDYQETKDAITRQSQLAQNTIRQVEGLSAGERANYIAASSANLQGKAGDKRDQVQQSEENTNVGIENTAAFQNAQRKLMVDRYNLGQEEKHDQLKREYEAAILQTPLDYLDRLQQKRQYKDTLPYLGTVDYDTKVIKGNTYNTVKVGNNIEIARGAGKNGEDIYYVGGKQVTTAKGREAIDKYTRGQASANKAAASGKKS